MKDLFKVISRITRNGISPHSGGIRLIYSALSTNGEIMMGRGVIDRVQAVGDGLWPARRWPAFRRAGRLKWEPTSTTSPTASQNPRDGFARRGGYLFGEPFANYAQKMTYTDEEKLLSRVDGY
jgi:hypothetical protein